MEIDTKELDKRIDIMHNEKAKMDYFKYVFEKDDNGAFVRLIIPLNFVKSIIPSKNEPMNYM